MYDTVFAAILSDVQMAKMDGMSLLDNIQLYYPAIAVVIMSDLAEQAVQAQQRARRAICQSPSTGGS